MYDDVNERLELRIEQQLVETMRPELAGFFRRLQLSHVLEELLLPLSATTRMVTAIAYDERPWPPAGVGARSLRSLAWAVISEDGQALLTPPLLHPQYVTNVGLAAATTKILLEKLCDDGIEWVSFFVNQRSKVVVGELRLAGFEPRQARIATDGTEFVAFAASPQVVLDSLSLSTVRLGDVLSLAMESKAVSNLTAFYLTLATGIRNYWTGNIRWAEVFPGVVDWAALPPGGITGTAGPTGENPMDPVIIIHS
jgi:hypothetical protein